MAKVILVILGLFVCQLLYFAATVTSAPGKQADEQSTKARQLNSIESYLDRRKLDAAEREADDKNRQSANEFKSQSNQFRQLSPTDFVFFKQNRRMAGNSEWQSSKSTTGYQQQGAAPAPYMAHPSQFSYNYKPPGYQVRPPMNSAAGYPNRSPPILNQQASSYAHSSTHSRFSYQYPESSQPAYPQGNVLRYPKPPPGIVEEDRIPVMMLLLDKPAKIRKVPKKNSSKHFDTYVTFDKAMLIGELKHPSEVFSPTENSAPSSPVQEMKKEKVKEVEVRKPNKKLKDVETQEQFDSPEKQTSVEKLAEKTASEVPLVDQTVKVVQSKASDILEPLHEEQEDEPKEPEAVVEEAKRGEQSSELQAETPLETTSLNSNEGEPRDRSQPSLVDQSSLNQEEPDTKLEASSVDLADADQPEESASGEQTSGADEKEAESTPREAEAGEQSVVNLDEPAAGESNGNDSPTESSTGNQGEEGQQEQGEADDKIVAAEGNLVNDVVSQIQSPLAESAASLPAPSLKPLGNGTSFDFGNNGTKFFGI